MKPIPTHIILRDNGVIEIETLRGADGQPLYSHTDRRHDLPEVLFQTTKGEVWIKGVDIVAILFSDATSASQH